MVELFLSPLYWIWCLLVCQQIIPDFDYLRLVVIGRVVRIIRALRIIYLMVQQRRHVATASRRVVSQNKRRYQKDGFDLDLCYITERVIAMSFPSKGMMAMYRNPVREVARFFDEKHKDHFRIYNLCSERDYDEELFHNRVERVFIDDHNVPRLSEMVDFCDNAREFMSEDPQNVIAIHCKGGKGRTGTMICTWLIDCGLFGDAQESLDYFGDRRTDLTVGKTFQGVETPSQSRYVGYYEKVKKDLKGQLPPRKEKKMTSVKIEGLTGVGNGDGSDFSMEIRVDGLLIYECRFGDNINCQMMKYTDSDSIVVNLQNSPTLFADVKLRFFSPAKNIPKIYDNCAFFLWFHTSFIEDNKLRLTRDEIDNPHKKKAKEVYRDNFAVELNFEDADDD
ncbi:phosphatidylinositol 3,4,5-trisphosphate 3-phosphatase TPTE2-like [Pecten maximus]|uniref:phosphatidylinositol 3,4,5-trisphosphate 3-phosphatase TPTE2-like n=1 Tax=Pecten maximus TaxID=6579 RepID=UPI001458A634|nr:phosphatidylinositol 3,4,5-trisphosphate 3-phosphatase TPTE2-like [Pecten maximus]